MTESKYIQFFQNLMSPSKEIREPAEKDLERIKTIPIKESLQIFQEGMSSKVPTISQLATLLLKKIYLDDSNIKSKLTPEEVEVLKNILKSHLNFQTSSWKNLQRIADALGQIYKISNLQSAFTDIIYWLNLQEPSSRQFGIYIIEVLCDLEVLKDDVIKDNISNFKEMFIKGFNDTDDNVIKNTFNAFSQFLRILQDEKNAYQFTPLIDIMMVSLLNLTKKGSQAISEILQSLNLLTDKLPKFWKEKTDLLIQAVCTIANTITFSSQIRSSALELVYSSSSSMPAVIRKTPNFSSLMIPLLFKLLLEIDNQDDLQKWEKTLQEDEAERSEMYYSVRNGFGRLSVDLGGKFFLEATSGYIKEYFNSKNWIEIQGGFTALAYMVYGCKDVFSENLVEILGYISNGLIHEHPRVRYCALLAFGNILKETGPKPQKEYSNNFLPGLAKLLKNETSLKVKSQACSTLVDFLRGLIDENKDQTEEAEILKPYSSDLIQLISILFQESITLNYPPLQEYSLSSLSLLANILEKEFSPFYDMVMPGLKKLFYSLEPKTPEQKKLKSHCIETISYLFVSILDELDENINNDKYKKDLKEISESFSKLLLTLPEEDPQVVAILNSFIHISLAMESDFIPILNYLFPYLSNLIKADIGLVVKDNFDLNEYIPEDIPENEKKEGEEGKIHSVVVNLGTVTKKLSVHTFALQNKILAYNVLNEICLNLGHDFFPFTEKFLLLSKDLLKFPYSRKLRKLAFKSIYSCMNTCENDKERGDILTFIKSEVFGIFKYDVYCMYFKEISVCLKVFANFCELISNKATLPPDFITELYAILNDIMKKTSLRMKEIQAKGCDDCHEEDDLNDQKTDLEKLNNINRKVMELNGILFKLFGFELTEIVRTNLFDYFMDLWVEGIAAYNQTKNNSQLLYCISFFNNFIEYSDEVISNQFIPKYIELSEKSKLNEGTLKEILYGYGVICQRVKKDLFSVNYKDIVFGLIIKVIERGKVDSNKKTFDNAISAMGKYIFFQSENNEISNRITGQFLKFLPLENDLVEGKNICKILFEKIDENFPLLFNELNLPLTKNAIEKIILLNKTNNFIQEQIENLIMAALTLGINFQQN